MPTRIRSVPSAGYETARSLLVAALRTTTQPYPDGPIGRVVRFSQASAQSNLGFAFMRMVTVTEAFTDSVSLALFEARGPNRDDVFRRLVDDHTLGVITWAQRKESLGRYHAVQFNDCPTWTKVDAAIEVRNAIAHGLGSLTRRQRRDARTASKLQNLGIDVSEGKLLLKADDIRNCFDYCMEYIKWLDTKARGVRGFAVFSS